MTWAIGPSVPAGFVPVIRDSFAAWSSYGDIVFVETRDVVGANIEFRFGPLDGRGNTIGEASYRISGTMILSADITFDNAEGWRTGGTGVVSESGIDLRYVATHEIGHAIGLDHYDAEPAIMNTTVNRSVLALTESDILGIQAIYGATFPDDLVDDAFYWDRNPDVRAAGLDPDQHYNQYGWREGRDPNPLFDTSDYLAAYGDVRAAGINPLAHYHQYGWREGRDPSRDFDTDAYRNANGDVAAQGLDPLLHYLQYGRAEGRSAFADGVLG